MKRNEIFIKKTNSILVIQNSKPQHFINYKKDGVINPRNYNFNQFLTRKILMLSKRYESTEVDRRTWLHVPYRDTLVHQQ